MVYDSFPTSKKKPTPGVFCARFFEDCWIGQPSWPFAGGAHLSHWIVGQGDSFPVELANRSDLSIAM